MSDLPIDVVLWMSSHAATCVVLGCLLMAASWRLGRANRRITQSINDALGVQQ